MDLLKEIRLKIKDTPGLSLESGLGAVATHIEVAEKYYYQAKEEKFEHMYSDVIYRTNHAFEGVLKEAYLVFSGTSSSKKNTYEIEEYLLSNNILKGRVVDLLTNYRKSWRNPSTHDYQLFFSDQESYLAIVTVSAFVSILLDQIIGKLALDNAFYEIEKAAKKAREELAKFDSLAAHEKICAALMGYNSYYINNFDSMIDKPREVTKGEIAAFVKAFDPSFSVTINEVFDAGLEKVIFDLVFRLDSDIVAVETRHPKGHYSFDNSAMSQLIGHLRMTGIKSGILFHYPGEKTDGVMSTTSSSNWPKDLSLREVFSDDSSRYEDDILDQN